MAEKYDFVTTDAQSIYNSVIDSLMDEVMSVEYLQKRWSWYWFQCITT